MKQKGNIIVMAGPSGAGKTSLCRELLKVSSNLSFSVSATTRQKRQGEVDGKDYYFLTKNAFEHRIKKGDFLEYEEVFSGRFYGTLFLELDRIWKKGLTPVLDVDVKGAMRIKEKSGLRALFLFIHPVTKDKLKERLEKRGTEDNKTIEERLKRSEDELKLANRFDHTIMNDHFETAKMELIQLTNSFLNSEKTAKP